MEWEDREEHSLESTERLFKRLRQLLKDIPSLKLLAFIWCDDIYNEMGQALVKAVRMGDKLNIQQMWVKLEEEAYQRVNGAGFPCDCRRQCCFLTAPDRRETSYDYVHEKWQCTWTEAWYEGIRC